MSKFEINAIFYSNKNHSLAFDLKMSCKSIGINLIYSCDIPDLVKLLREININLVFIDSTSIKVTDNVLSFIKSYNNTHTITIVYINDSDTANICKGCDMVDFIINKNNLTVDLKDIEKEIKFSNINCLHCAYNYSEVSNFLTDYLLTLGFLPKHIGFTYIKQAVEIALKNNAILGSLSGYIYPTIARKNSTNPQNVERNIRNCIDYAINSKEHLTELKTLYLANKISYRAFLGYLLDRVTIVFGQ